MSNEMNIPDHALPALQSTLVRLDRNTHGHILQALRLQQLNDLSNFATTIGGSGVMAIGAALLGGAIDNGWAVPTITIVSSAITLIGVFQAVWKPGERALRHKMWCNEFAQLENKCRIAVASKRFEQLEEILAEFSAVSERADLVPERVWRRARSSSNEG